MKKVYVAGPYTNGDVARNVSLAVQAGAFLLNAGFAPYVPHLSHFMHMHWQQPYETWMRLDFEWVKSCDALLRLPGESSGADREVQLATELGLPIYTSLDDLIAAMT